VTLKDIAAMTTRIDPKDIWRARRKEKYRSGKCLKDDPSRNSFFRG